MVGDRLVNVKRVKELKIRPERVRELINQIGEHQNVVEVVKSKMCKCVTELHACQIIGSYARPNPDCKICHGTGVIE